MRETRSASLRKKAFCDKNPKVQKLSTRLVSCLVEYLQRSSLHGLQYLGEKERHPVERVCWVIAISLSILGCGYMINTIFTKWNTSPVMVTFSEKATPVWEIPFPAVTICSENKIPQRTYFNFTKIEEDHRHGRNMSEQTSRHLAFASLVCGKKIRRFKKNIVVGDDFYGFVQENSNILPIFHVMWKDDVFDSSRNIFTEEGMCETLNLLSPYDMFTDDAHIPWVRWYDMQSWKNSSGWSPEGGYPLLPRIDDGYPVRSWGAGSHAGLTFSMDFYPNNFDLTCAGEKYGFKMLLHNPATFPQMSQRYLRLPLDYSIVLAVKPRILTTSNDLRGYTPDRRLCYFNSERQLKFFKLYTQDNCKLECLTNYTLIKCQCVMWYMPRNKTTQLCSPWDVNCVTDAQDDFREAAFVDNLHSKMRDKEKTVNASNCNCLPACTEINYDFEMSLSTYNWMGFGGNFPDKPRYKERSFGVVNIFFKEEQFISSKRTELYGQTDFLANCGGLLSLFLGFSLISLMELFYFLIVRIPCEVFRQYSFHEGRKSKVQPFLN